MRQRDESRPPTEDPAAARPPVGPSDSYSSADEPTRVSDSRHQQPRAVPRSDRPQIEGYELLEEVHRGGQGIVFRARQLGTKRDVALKVLLEGAYASDTARRRFEREVELAASLKHPHIVTILDSGISLGRMYFVMEFIDGLRLDQFLRQNVLPLDRTLALFDEIAQAVNFAHQRGVIHRDLKPSNILVDREGTPHVLDFGLAKTTRSTDPDATIAALSTTGQVIGTLAYMSPEQAAGSDDLDVRSDVYSLGVIFYEALLGRTPYPVSGPLGEVLQRIASDEPVPPRSLRLSSRFGRQIGDEVETILLKALEKEPTRRYQTAGDLARDLHHYLNNEPVEAKRASGLYMLRKTLRKYRWQAAAGVVLLLTVLTSLVSFAVMYRRESLLRADAEDLRKATASKAAALEISLRKTEDAEKRASTARETAEDNERRAVLSAESLKQALIRQKIQRGDLAKIRGDLVEARDSYWDAFDDAPDNAAALWQLRRYYFDSGEAGSVQLAMRAAGPIAVSSDGRWAAACETAASVTVRDAGTGRALGWRSAPDSIATLAIDDSRSVAVANKTWARVWPGPDAAAIDIVFPDRFEADAIALVADGRKLAVIGDQSLLLYALDARPQPLESPLKGEVRGEPAYNPALRMLAIPTSAGAEAVSFDATGGIAQRHHWPGVFAGGARGVAFVGDTGIAVVGDAIDRISLKPGQVGQVSRLFTPQKPWDFVQAARDGDMLALGSRDGRVGIYWNGALENEWQVTHGRLLGIRIDPERHAVLTLDDRGVLSKWTPRTYERTREPIHDKSAAKWVLSADGSTILIADSSGRLVARSTRGNEQTTQITLPSLVEIVAGRSLSDLSLALSGDGRNAVVVTGDRIWYKSLDRPRPQLFRWNNNIAPRLASAALSQDGRVLALYSTNEAADRQVISFSTTGSTRGGPPVRAGLAGLGRPYDIAGSAVRSMAFMPGSEQLVVARSNGELLLLSPADDARPADARELRSASRETWAMLDSPAYMLAFDRDGHTLAAACDDGTVRIIAALDVSEIGHFNVGRRIASLSFNSGGGLLLARTEDGAVHAYETGSGDKIAQWAGGGATGPTALATWYGDDDAILISEPEGVFIVRHKGIDAIIESSRTFAQQRRASRRLAEGDLVGTWLEAERLAKLDPGLGREAQLVVVEQSLRRLRSEPAESWLTAVQSDSSADALIRLGHAAYDGERFELAARWLKAAAESNGGKLDFDSERHLAACEYLLGDSAASVARFGALVDRSAKWEVRTGLLTLQWIAALVENGRIDDARRIVRSFDSLAPAEDNSLIASLTTSAIGGMIVEGERELRLSPPARAFVTTVLAAQWANYRDDVEFFLGENARRRGEQSVARDHYQRCLDLARDPWPANWARFRLRQLDAPAP
jgi:WD40 repeat protein/predicted Ser/Thr protein kinase